MSTATRPLVLLGAGGHARVLAALARAAGHPVLGVCDPALAADAVSRWEDLDVLGDDDALDWLPPDRVALMLGVGQLASGTLRQRLYASWQARGYGFPALVHPAAWVAPGVVLGDGVQVMAGAVIQPGCEIGENSIINTRASVDHDCRISRDVHVAPGATLCGSVTVEAGAFVGAGATVIQGVRIGERAVVGAGVTLVRDLTPATTILGAANRLR
ncbi:acetyltransferase [Paucibacter sp. O1-1]|nr:acetyltransferase [Paucibacter sp. O1-1]MDA3828345.1 acetyltransferase [Paucibacter sp. O1-1]